MGLRQLCPPGPSQDKWRILLPSTDPIQESVLGREASGLSQGWVGSAALAYPTHFTTRGLRPIVCPHCASPATVRQPKTTALGYQTFRCAACRCTFNERTGTPFNFLEYPTDIVLLVVLLPQ